MVSVRSSPDRAVRVQALARDIVLCSWARHCTLTVSLSTQGWAVRRPFNANPRLKVNRSIKMFFTAYVLCSVRLFRLKNEGQTIYRKLHRKVTKLKSKFSIILGYLNRALNNATRVYGTRDFMLGVTLQWTGIPSRGE